MGKGTLPGRPRSWFQGEVLTGFALFPSFCLQNREWTLGARAEGGGKVRVRVNCDVIKVITAACKRSVEVWMDVGEE